ncbi:calpain-1 catalytic subunit [Pimephales promelas]|nr:calpain-1 catalytic subunit [Pimephales promelas]
MPPPDGCNHNPHEDDVNSPTSPFNFLDQNYQELHQNCLAENTLFYDELFPPDDSSIGTLEDNPYLDPSLIVWKRPFELVSDPNLIVDGVSRYDYAQGNVGNCWFLASIGALTFEKDIMKQVMPPEQSFTQDYAGIFHFRFWRFGKWIDVVIDDQLPTYFDELLFVSSKTSNEFWPALLEKAYAKVCGSYADLNGGLMSEALMDFTGGTHMYYSPDYNPPPADLWKIMECAFTSKALICCATNAATTAEEKEKLHGISEEHAYTVTGIFEVTSDENPVHLVRVLNPWGKVEWQGDWSDESPLWDTVCEEVRTICHEVLNNGEFWMSVEDFTSIFYCIDICCSCPDFLDGSSECHWTSKRHFGRWNAETTAETFPQFRVTIDELNEECAIGQRPENTLVSLMQNHEKRNRMSQKYYNICFFVFEIPLEMRGQSGRFSAGFVNETEPVAQTDALAGFREVMKFFRLEPGEYLIVPCTENPGDTASFVLSIFSKNETHFEYVMKQ